MAIERRIQTIRREAVTAIELGKIKDIGHRLCRRFLSGKMTLDDFRRETDALLRPGQLLVDTPEEFRQTLRHLGCAEKLIEGTLEHELIHFNKALEVGLRVQFAVQFVKPKILTNFRNGAVSITIPDSFTDDEARIALRAVIEAPGIDDMSEGDIDHLPEHEELRKSINYIIKSL